MKTRILIPIIALALGIADLRAQSPAPAPTPAPPVVVTLTFTFPDQATATNMINAVAASYGYQPIIGSNSDGTFIQNPVAALDFVKQKIAADLKQRALDQLSQAAANAAANAAKAAIQQATQGVTAQ